MTNCKSLIIWRGQTYSTLNGLNEMVFQKSLPYSQETLKCSSHSCSMTGLYWIESVFHIT